MSAILRLEHIDKSYGKKEIFEDFCLEIEENKILVIMGKSGKGKTTLLNIIGLIEKIDGGKLLLYNKEIKKNEVRKIHSEKIGFLFQNFALLEEKTVLYNLNIIFPTLKQRKVNKDKILKILEDVDLKGYENKLVCECSGGEKQRIAVARAVLHQCDIILADEPTGSLDKENKQMIMDLFIKLKEMGRTLVIVTHDSELRAIADSVLEL